ncbi:core histone H2A/H2B/H3/H4 [Cooperia oncophora]
MPEKMLKWALMHATKHMVQEETISLLDHEADEEDDDLTRLPKDEQEVNSTSNGEGAIRVVKVIGKNKRRKKVFKEFELIFPRMKFYRCLRRLTRLRVADTAPVSLAAIMKFLVEEVFSYAHECMIRQKRKRITPQHIGMGVRIDDELGQLFKGILIPSAGRFGTFYLTR